MNARFWGQIIFALGVSSLGLNDRAIAIPPAIEQQLRAITVRIDGDTSGSGVVVDRQGASYRLLTNAHLFDRKGDRTLVTSDGYCHAIASVSPLPKVDLALVQFVSSQDHAIAKLEKNPESSGDRTVFVGGWAASGGNLQPRVFLITEGVTMLAQSRLPPGYDLTYSNLVRVGMSGGAIVNEKGNLIGINGIVHYLSPRSNTIVGSGIPIGYFSRWYAQHRSSLPAMAKTIPRPRRSPCN